MHLLREIYLEFYLVNVLMIYQINLDPQTILIN